MWPRDEQRGDNHEGLHRSGNFLGRRELKLPPRDESPRRRGRGVRAAALQVGSVGRGHGVKSRFFTTEEPIGKPIKVGSVWLTVVGVLEDRKSRIRPRRSSASATRTWTSTCRSRRCCCATATAPRHREDVQQASREVNDDPNATANEDAEQRAERTTTTSSTA